MENDCIIALRVRISPRNSFIPEKSAGSLGYSFLFQHQWPKLAGIFATFFLATFSDKREVMVAADPVPFYALANIKFNNVFNTCYQLGSAEYIQMPKHYNTGPDILMETNKMPSPYERCVVKDFLIKRKLALYPIEMFRCVSHILYHIYFKSM